MTPIDTKLYELFADKTLSEGCRVYPWGDDFSELCIYLWNGKYWNIEKKYISYMPDNEITDWWTEEQWFDILWHEPQLHDVVRIMRMKGINLYMDNEQIIIFQDSSVSPVYVPYNPTLSLINQEESTKQAIVDLFSN